MTMQKSPPGRAKAATNGAQKPKPAKTTYEKSGVKAPVTNVRGFCQQVGGPARSSSLRSDQPGS